MREAPYTRITLLDGEYVPLEGYLNAPTAIMFWASWCSASRSNIDDYVELSKNYRSLHFLAISLDESTEEDQYREYLRHNNLLGPIHAFSGNQFDDEAVNAFHVEEIPTYFFLDRGGRVLYQGDDLDDLEDAIIGMR